MPDSIGEAILAAAMIRPAARDRSPKDGTLLSDAGRAGLKDDRTTESRHAGVSSASQSATTEAANST
jgi:hypothetical protein